MSLASFRFQFGDARSSVNLFHLEDAMHQFSFWVYYPISALSSIQTLILDVEPNFCFWNAIYKGYLRPFPFQYFPVLNKKTARTPSRKAVGLLRSTDVFTRTPAAGSSWSGPAPWRRRDRSCRGGSSRLRSAHNSSGSSSFLYLWSLKFLKKSQVQDQKARIKQKRRQTVWFNDLSSFWCARGNSNPWPFD
mgnify:FL=1